MRMSGTKNQLKTTYNLYIIFTRYLLLFSTFFFYFLLFRIILNKTCNIMIYFYIIHLTIHPRVEV